MKNYIILLFVFNISCVDQKSKQSYTSEYALDFNMAADSTIVYPWLASSAYAYCTKFVRLLEGNSAFSANVYQNDDYKGVFNSLNCLRAEQVQRILLPIHKEKNGKISFLSMGENIETGCLTIEGISKEEKVLFSKTIKFSHQLPLAITPTILPQNIVSTDIPLTDVKLLNININVKGEKNKNAVIVFRKLDVFIGNQSIDEFPIRELSSIPKDFSIKTIAIDLDSNNGFDKIEELKSSKIIGLGESIHGSGIVNQFAYKLIMQQVEEENCKLVIIEKHFEEILPYNRYILDENFVLNEEHTEDFELMRLLEDIRKYNYNKSLEEKVRIFGMDYNTDLTPYINTLSEIFDYLTHLNEMIKAEEIDQFALFLINQDWKGAISFLSENRYKMEKLFPFGEYESIVHILNLSKNIGLYPIERYLKRDSVMFVNSKFLIDNFLPKDAKVLIYGHSTHINPVSTYPFVSSVPFGSFIKKEYSNNYSSLLILAGEGCNMAHRSSFTKPWLFTKGRLSTPPIGSMEYFLNSLGKELLYLPLTPDFNRLVLSRSEGSHHLASEFYPFNLYQRYDGVFFIKNIETASEQKEDVSYDEFTKKINDKIIRRQKISEEITKRLNSNN